MATGSTRYTRPHRSICRRSAISLALTAGALLAAAGGAALVDARADRREARAEAQFPPIGQIVHVGAQSVHAVTIGTGPDLVLIHGASGNLRDFTHAFADRMARTYRVTIFDRPGFGWSSPLPANGDTLADQARTLQAAAHKLGLRDPVVLGHSYGGSVALAWACYLPDTLGALVPLAAASMVWQGPVAPFYRITGNPLGQRLVVPLVAAFVGNARVETAMCDTFAPQSPPDGYAAHFGAGLALRRMTLRINARQRIHLKRDIRAMTPLYANIKQPVEIVHGDADATVPLSIHAEPLAAMLPTATLTVLDRVGHIPHHVRPDDVAAAIDRAATRAGLR